MSLYDTGIVMMAIALISLGIIALAAIYDVIYWLIERWRGRH